MGPACWAELEQKRFDAAATDALNDRLARRWDAMRNAIAAVTVPAAPLRASLVAAGAPVEPAALGWSEGLWRDALVHAREIRNRYTFLDVTEDSGPLI
jgi:glycerol-1-phosphate dehydrogenase [NAD(P)+]